MRFLGGYATDVGHTRKVNQDAVILKNASFDENGLYDKEACNAGFAVLAVCDGIGVVGREVRGRRLVWVDLTEEVAVAAAAEAADGEVPSGGVALHGEVLAEDLLVEHRVGVFWEVASQGFRITLCVRVSGVGNTVNDKRDDAVAAT